MKATRRGFLGILGGAAVGGKKAAANAATTLLGGLGALSPEGDGASLPPASGGYFDPWDEDSAGLAKIKDPSMLRVLGIPEFLKDEWREDSRKVNRFDPDIASMNSFSLAGKINLQRERNLVRWEEEFFERGSRRLKQKAWEKINGRITWW